MRVIVAARTYSTPWTLVCGSAYDGLCVDMRDGNYPTKTQSGFDMRPRKEFRERAWKLLDEARKRPYP